MRRTIVLWKPVGISPLDLSEQFKVDHPEYAAEKIGYAGRLDPMASGLVIYLIGEENKNREDYLSLDKEYSVEILLGMATDSYDILGNIVESAQYMEIPEEKVGMALAGFIGTHEQHYPPFSSKPLNGKPLYYWARRGELHMDDLPKKERTIYSIELEGIKMIPKAELAKKIDDRLEKVQGNFHQAEIRTKWQEFFTKAQDGYAVVSIRVSCSSGTYMRSLAHNLGEQIGLPACALSIVRTKIGKYESADY